MVKLLVTVGKNDYGTDNAYWQDREKNNFMKKVDATGRYVTIDSSKTL